MSVCVCCVVKLLDFSLKRESCNLLLLSFEFPDTISKLHKPIVRCQCPLTVAVMILYANVVGHSWSFTKKKSRRVIDPRRSARQHSVAFTLHQCPAIVSAIISMLFIEPSTVYQQLSVQLFIYPWASYLWILCCSHGF